MHSRHLALVLMLPLLMVTAWARGEEPPDTSRADRQVSHSSHRTICHGATENSGMSCAAPLPH